MSSLRDASLCVVSVGPAAFPLLMMANVRLMTREVDAKDIRHGGANRIHMCARNIATIISLLIPLLLPRNCLENYWKPSIRR